MIKTLRFVLIVTLLTTSPVFAQDLTRIQIQKLTKIEPESTVRPSYLLPPQGQPSTPAAKPSAGTSHKKRNIIIVVVAAGVVGGVIIAAHNGAYGSSSNMSTGTGY